MDPHTPFQILVLGDFSGRGNVVGAEASADLARRRPIPLDRDRLDAVIERLGVRCDVALGDDVGCEISLRFQRLDDFHPDRLVESVPQLAQLMRIRQGLLSPATFEKAAAEVRAWGIVSPRAETDPAEAKAAAETSPPQVKPPESIAGDGVLDLVLGQTSMAEESSEPPPLPRELAELVRRAAAPYRVAKPHPEQADLVACVEAVAGHLLRAILHSPRFQALEAAWRGLAFLVRRLPTGPRLKVFLLDVSRAELAEDFRTAPSLESAAVSRLLVDATVGTPGAEPWAVVAAHYPLDATKEDLLLAACLARISARAGATLLAGADARLVGCDSLAATPDPEDWRTELSEQVRQTYAAIRALPDASHLGLVLPRFLLRLPYGSQSGHGSPVQSFPFEEMAGPPSHESYLWGNPALAAAYLLGRSFFEHGWAMQPETTLRIDGLPIHAFEQDGQYEVKPCAEALLSDRAALRILDLGIMPLQWIRGTDTIQLAGWRGAKSPIGRLAGRGMGDR